MSDISALDRYAYEHGHHPLDWAEYVVGSLIDVHLTVVGDRLDDPDSWPGYTIEPTIEALASRILGELLDAGWTPPEMPS